MIGSIQSALSGLQANQRRVDVAAENIANADTNGYRKRVVQLAEVPGGGVVASTGRTGDAAAAGGATASDSTRPSDVDLTEEIPSLDLSKGLYQANLAVIKTQDEMLGSLLDRKD